MWKDIFAQDSPVSGKKYGDLIDMRITPFVLPYHIHSYQMTQVFPLLDDLCSSGGKCLHNEYAELCWGHMPETVRAKDKSEKEFTDEWAETIANNLGIPKDEILSLYTEKDTHDSDWRVREDWKYGASIGISGTPMLYINGVKLTDEPESKEDWKTLIDSLLDTDASTPSQPAQAEFI